jgi:tetratricopeptide (TPR) repeat protein
MKYLLAIALALLSYLAGAGQNKLRKEINYIQSTHKGANEIIVETGYIPNLYFLRVKNNPMFVNYSALLKQHATKDYLNSRKLFEFSIEENTNNIKSLRVLNKKEEELYKPRQPAPALAIAAAEVDNKAPRFYDSALLLFHEHKYDECIKIIDSAIVINTQNPDYHNFKALCLANLQQYRQSTEECKYALELDAANAELHEIMANNYYFLKDPESATTNYEKAIEYDRSPHITRIYHNYVKHLIEVPDPQRAIEVYNLYLYRTDGLPGYIASGTEDLAFYAGQAYQQIGKWNKALEIYNRLTVMKPGVYGYYAQRGRLYQQMKNWQDAISDFETALTLDTTKNIVLTNLAQLYQELKDYKKSEESYLKYLQHHPEDAMQTGNFGYLLLDAERYNEAQQMFNRSLSVDDNNIDTYIGLILSSFLLGDAEKKQAYIGKTKLKFPQIPMNAATLHTLIKTGNYYYSDKIITIWEHAID